MPSVVALIDYGSGNLRSAANAVARAAREAGLAAETVVTGDPETVRRADRIVLPGVGAFADCMNGLTAVPGLYEAITDVAVRRGRPFLGICVGMQLMATTGREHGDHAGLGWVKGEVTRLAPEDRSLKVPHMGWNELDVPAGSARHPVLDGLDQRDDGPRHAYFAHSYHFRPAEPDHVLATVDYGGQVTAVIGRDNLVGTQFHPEKSQATGLRLIANFLKWQP